MVLSFDYQCLELLSTEEEQDKVLTVRVHIYSTYVPDRKDSFQFVPHLNIEEANEIYIGTTDRVVSRAITP